MDNIIGQIQDVTDKQEYLSRLCPSGLAIQRNGLKVHFLP